MRPLEGVTVVTIEQAVAAPLCSARLRHAGARVIKIERAEGDFGRNYDTAAKGDSSYFVWLTFDSCPSGRLAATQFQQIHLYTSTLFKGVGSLAQIIVAG